MMVRAWIVVEWLLVFFFVCSLVWSHKSPDDPDARAPARLWLMAIIFFSLGIWLA